MDKMLKLYKTVDGVEVAFPNDSIGQIELSSFDYSSQRMSGIPIIAGTIMHEKCLDDYFKEVKPQEVYVVFNEEKYFLKSTPTSSFSNTDARYKHDVSFVSERSKLSSVYFYDVVSSDITTDKPVSNSSVVTFFGNIQEFAARLNYSLQYAKLQTIEDGVVSGYNVVVDDGVTSEDKLISFTNQYFEAVLQQTFDLYGIPHYFKGKTIHFGWADSDSIIDETLKYGKDNSLLSITKSNTNDSIINRCTGIGSADNIPFYYPNNSELGELDYKVYSQSHSNVTNRFFVKDYNKLAKSVQVGTTYKKYDKSDYLDFDVLQVLFRRYEGTTNSDWEPAKRGQSNVGYEQTITLPQIGGVPLPGCNHEYRIDFVMSEDASIKLKFLAVFKQPEKIAGQTIKLSDLTFAKSGGYISIYDGLWENGKVPIKTLTTSGDEITIPLTKGTYSVVITINVNKIYDNFGLFSALYSVETFDVDEIYSFEKEWEWENENGHKFRTLKKVGIDGNESSLDEGATMSTEILFRVPPQPNLMPYVYRQTRGEERFYNAENDTYRDEYGEYYHFNNPYIEGNPKEHIETFDDIKPTIEGIYNYEGLPINVFSEVEFEGDDTDEKDGNALKCPYFYAKLRKFDGNSGFNLFDYASEEGEMTLSMTSGTCGACQFKIAVDENGKNLVHVDSNGNLSRNITTGKVVWGSPQDKQNDTKNNEVWVALFKDEDTFGTVMPNVNNNYMPSAGDSFVILHIQLPREYIWDAERRLSDAIVKHMADNNDEKFKFSIKFSRIYLAENPDVLKRLSENSTIRFEYNGVEYYYYVSSYSCKCKNDEPLPEISVELSDTITANRSVFKDALNEVRDGLDNAEDMQNQIVNVTLQNYIRNDIDNSVKASINFQKGISIGSNPVTSVINTRTLTPASDDYIYTSAMVEERIDEKISKTHVDYTKFLRKDIPDIAYKKIAFNDGLVAGDFLKGLKGIGLYKDINNNWHIETDYLDVRYKFTTKELEILHTSHVGGVVVNSAANMVVVNVEETEDAYICYMNTEDGDGNKIENKWAVGDQAYCETFNLVQQSNGSIGNHFLWRLVIDRGDNFISLSKHDCALLSDAPMVGDILVVLGNRNDIDRQGAIIQAASGSGSPYIRVLNGIIGYELPTPSIDLSPHGSRITAESVIIEATGNPLDEELQGINGAIDSLSRDLSGSFLVWQAEDNEVPTLNNEPAVNWENDTERFTHVGDFYITTSGWVYQFDYDSDSNTYYWKIITDKYLIKVAKDVEERSRTFVETPTIDDVYDIGDTWVNATYPEDGRIYNDDTLVCIKAKDKGEPFDISHWRKDSKYTDDTKANLLEQEMDEFIEGYESTISDIQGQIDGKAETWYQENDPSTAWDTDELKAMHKGDLWYNEETGETFYWNGSTWEQQNIPKDLFDRFDGKATIYVSKPINGYMRNDMWILEEDYTLNGEYLKKGTIVFTDTTSETFVETHWGKYDRYTDDTKAEEVEQEFNNFVTSYEEAIADIRKQIDGKAETWYQENDPSTAWDTDELKAKHVGDLWYNTTEEKTYYWNGSKWEAQDIPQEVFDDIDGKSSIFVSQPKYYKKNDIWVLDADYVLAFGIKYKKGTIVFALEDSPANGTETLVPDHWGKKDIYTDDEAVDDLKDKLLNTGIAFNENTITATAETFKVQSRVEGAEPIAVFGTEEIDGKTVPYISGDLLRVNYVNINNGAILLNKDGSGQLANGAIKWDRNGTFIKDTDFSTGTMANFTIQNEVFGSYEYGVLRSTGYSCIFFEFDTNTFLRLNDPTESSFYLMNARKDEGVAISVYSFRGTAIQALSPTCAIEATGNSLLQAGYTSKERVKIKGLSVSTKTPSYTLENDKTNLFSKDNKWVDFLVPMGDVVLPSAAGNDGKILFVKANGTITSSDGIILASESYDSNPTTSITRNNRAMMYISNGINWYEFYCG